MSNLVLEKSPVYCSNSQNFIEVGQRVGGISNCMVCRANCLLARKNTREAVLVIGGKVAACTKDGPLLRCGNTESVEENNFFD